MAQTVEEIAELINNLHDENKRNNESFEKVLANINAKIELMSDDANADAIRLYFSELKKSMEDKYADASFKFEEIQRISSNLLSYQDELAKGEEIKLLFSNFNDVFEKFLLETQHRKEILENIEKQFQGIVTEDDFQNFKSDMAEFTQKVIDNSTVLNEELKAAFVRVENAVASIETEDYKVEFDKLSEQFSDKLAELKETFENSSSSNFESLSQKIEAVKVEAGVENLANSVNDIRASFENNSKMNYENLVSEINNLKSEIISNLSSNDNSEDFEQINSSLNDLITNVHFLMDLFSQNNSELLDGISAETELILSKFKEDLSADSEMNFGNIKASVGSLNNAIKQLKKDITDSDNARTFVISNGFNNLKSALDSMPSMLGSLQNNILQVTNDKSINIIENIKELSLQFEDIKTILANYDNTDKIQQYIEELSNQIAALNNDTSSESVEAVNSAIASLSSELNLAKLEYEQTLKENYENYSGQLKSVHENIANVRQYISEAIDSVKDYISEAQQISSDSREIKYADLVQKLSDIEGLLTQSSQDYEYKSENLQSKLSDFVQLVENSSSDTESKLSASLDELGVLKEELSSLNDIVKALKISNDEKSAESISIIDAGIENIILTLKNVSDEIKKGSEVSVGCLIENSDKKFSQIKELLSELKNNDNSDVVVDKISESVTSINSELRLVATDISEALQNKAEDMSRAFSNIKDSLDAYTGFDAERILESIKNQLESSFANYSADINNELASYSGNFYNLEQAYKNSLDKISHIEEFVTEKIQNDIELINMKLENNISNLQNSIGEGIGEQIQGIQNSVNSILNDKSVFESFDDLKNDFKEKFDSLNSNQNFVSAKQDEIQDDINKLFDNLKSFINIAAQKVIDDTNPEKIINKIDELQDKNSVISDGINELNAKLDVIVADSTSDDIGLRFDEIADVNNQISDKISALNNKVNILATDTSADDIKSKLDAISDKSEKLMSSYAAISDSEKAISDIVQIISAKVDAIATDSSLDGLLEEIDDVKSIIFEQHKNFEISSDERLAAIDKYLKDVLVKLDNVDLEKSADDIKEAIMNALISVVDQISFVEESEDIKGFVEEKTEEINKNIIEVQNQLKQLSTSDDAFDYTYTLQDVESDIAKLRLAINNIQGADYSDLSYEMKKIVDAVDSLETSLTQDEMIDLKANMENLAEDILSISVRTNKILLNSDESFKTLTDGLNNFSEIIYKLEDRINNLYNSETSSRIENKLDRIQSMALASSNADKVFHQAFMYLGEWVDATTENISSISDRTARINDLEKSISDIKASMPLKDDILNEIKELLPDNQDLIGRLVSKFQLQEERIDMLENKIEKILSTIEAKDDTVLNRKMDKIEKMLSKLGTNIEKLTSYVDEE